MEGLGGQGGQGGPYSRFLLNVGPVVRPLTPNTPKHQFLHRSTPDQNNVEFACLGEDLCGRAHVLKKKPDSLVGPKPHLLKDKKPDSSGCILHSVNRERGE